MEWKAECSVDTELASGLVARQFPELETVLWRKLGSGWDNEVYLANKKWVFRFPRRHVAVSCLETEVKVLPWLSSQLDTPVPRPALFGQSSAEFPWPFWGHAYLPGHSPRDVPKAKDQIGLARAVGAFLKQLHSLPCGSSDEPAPPPDLLERANLERRLRQIRRRSQRVMAQVDVRPILEVADELEKQLATTSECPAETSKCWVHGDLYGRNLLLGPDGGLAGIIDWGDAHIGDPALDLSVAWSFFSEPARAELRQAYGEVDEATWSRARVRALAYGVTLVDYASVEQDSGMFRLGKGAIEYAL